MKNDKNITIKGADKGSGVVVWEKRNYINEAEKHLGVLDVYEEVSDDSEPLIHTLLTTLRKVRNRRDSKKENIQYFEVKDPTSAELRILLSKIHKQLHDVP